MTALQTVAEIRSEILTMIGAASDNALDDGLSKNDRRVCIVVSTVLSDLLGKIAIADTHPKDGDVKQAPLVSGGGSEGNRP